MDYELTEKQNELRTDMEGFFVREMRHRSAIIEENKRKRAGLMCENLRKLGERGYLSLALEGDPIDYCIVGEELAKVCPSTFFAAMSSAVSFGVPLMLFGREDQKEQYLQSLRGAERVGCLACTESQAGTDIAAIGTYAEKKDGKWVLRGAKNVVTNAPIADLFLVLAWTDKDAGHEKGMTLFIVDRGTRGLKIGKAIETMGLCGAPTAGIKMTDCVLTADAVLGQEGSGYGQYMKIMESMMFSISVLSLGIGVGAMEESTRYSRERKAFGKAIGLFEGVGAKLATMFTLIDLGRMLVLRAAWSMANNDREQDILVRCAKLFTSESVNTVTDLGMQIHGGNGYLRGTRIERYYRDSRFAEIACCTSEMVRARIAEDSLDRFRPQ